MFVVFRRRHYNKALLVMLTTFLHWQGNATSMFETVRQHLAAFDEYPVENFLSVLRKRTKETDTADEIASKAKEIDACKHELHSFQSTFVPPRKFNFSSKRINKLKAKAAQFLTIKFESLFTHPNQAQPRVKRQPKHTTKWKLPDLFGEKIVTNRVLPLGFTSKPTLERLPCMVVDIRSTLSASCLASVTAVFVKQQMLKLWAQQQTTLSLHQQLASRTTIKATKKASEQTKRTKATMATTTKSQKTNRMKQ